MEADHESLIALRVLLADCAIRGDNQLRFKAKVSEPGEPAIPISKKNSRVIVRFFCATTGRVCRAAHDSQLAAHITGGDQACRVIFMNSKFESIDPAIAELIRRSGDTLHEN